MRTARKNPGAKKTAGEFDFDAPRSRPVARQPRVPVAKPAKRKRRDVETVRKEKREKFKQIIGPRAAKAIHDIRLLTHGSNRKRYFYTGDDIDKLRQALLEEVEAALAPYAPPRTAPESIDFE